MGTPITDATTPAIEELRHSGYDIQLLVDAIEVPYHRLSRVHLSIVGDTITLSGSAILKLKKDEIVTLRLKPKGLRPKKYRIPANGATLTGQLLRWY